ncbi:hypothetical protein [Pseudogemmobacter faecipullorum]|uniref:Uncharacterized protein n=1 Tax=Pseudogemmobacter faecipullorum TaxID=2755041 RepID=A0ABS8CTP4_9RHOB|nr:hypothetical protein [Pseudogemmobacter faecipullorum]MCB5412190.1 hypothetical protein [Pseudogemmobacter faecipullorum]
MEQLIPQTPSGKGNRFDQEMDRHLGKCLAEIGPKTRSVFSKKELLARHLEGLRNAVALGHSAQDISDHLQRELGLQISPSSLREALRPPKAVRKAARPRRQPGATPAASSRLEAKLPAQKPDQVRNADKAASQLSFFEPPQRSVFNPASPFDDDPAGEA